MKLSKALILIFVLTAIDLIAFQNCGSPNQNIGTVAAPPVQSLNSLEVEIEPSIEINDLNHDQECPPIKGTDIYLSIAQIQDLNGQAILEILDIEPAISVLKNSLRVRSLLSQQISNIQLALVDSSSFLLGENEAAYGVSAAPLQVPLSNPINLKQGSEYELTFQLDLGDQASLEGRKCLIKPIIQTAGLSIL
jgi:hypothetical protein